MPFSSIALNIVIATTFATELGHTLTGAGRVCDDCSLIEAMPQCFSIICDKGASAAHADVGRMTVILAICRSHDCLIVMRLGIGNVSNLTLPAYTALFDRIAGVDASSFHLVGGVLMLTLWCSCFLAFTAVLANFQRLSAYLASGITNDNGLPSMTDCLHIITLFNLAAVHAHIAVIANALAGWLNAFDDNKVVIFSTATACAAAISAVIFAAVAIIHATTAWAIMLRLFLISEPNIGNTVLYHALSTIGVSDFVIDSVLSLLGISGRSGHVAALSRITVTDSNGNAIFRQV